MKILLLCILLLSVARNAPAEEERDLLKRTSLEVEGRPAFVILPSDSQRREVGRVPWVFYAPTFAGRLPRDKDEGWMMRRFLAKGIAVAGVDVGESYGSPAGRAVFNALHGRLVEEYSFDPKACLLARSRGGLMLYCWAVENPEKVRAIAGIYPVCDLSSYPGIEQASSSYGVTAQELAAELDQHNPIPRIAVLAKAGVPIFHIHGDKDKAVPLEENSGALAKAYQELGGSMQLKVAEGQWHNMWRGFFECEELVDFVIDHALSRRTAADLSELIAHWKLDEADGEVAVDSAGGHHGRIVGAASVEGIRNKARLFDRLRGDHIAVPYSKDFALSTFTVAAWIKLTRPPTFSGIVGTRFGGEYTFDMKVNDAKVHGDIGNGEHWIEKEVNFYADDTGTNGQGGDLDLELWYHVTYVIDSEARSCSLYLNGDLKKEIPFEGQPVLMKPGQQLRIGNSSSDEFMDGVIDEVQVWATALTASQVEKLARRSSATQTP